MVKMEQKINDLFIDS